MKQWLLFIPLNYNDGLPVPKNIINSLKRLLAARFTGVTTIPNGQGLFFNKKLQLFRDNIQVVQVIAPAGQATELFMKEFGEHMRVILDQNVVLMIVFPVKSLKISLK